MNFIKYLFCSLAFASMHQTLPANAATLSVLAGTLRAVSGAGCVYVAIKKSKSDESKVPTAFILNFMCSNLADLLIKRHLPSQATFGAYKAASIIGSSLPLYYILKNDMKGKFKGDRAGKKAALRLIKIYSLLTAVTSVTLADYRNLFYFLQYSSGTDSKIRNLLDCLASIKKNNPDEFWVTIFIPMHFLIN